MVACTSISTTTPPRRRSSWCSRRSPCSCSCTSCSRRSWNGRRTSCRPARTATSRRLIFNDLKETHMSFEDKAAAHSGSATCTFHADDIAASSEFRRDYATRPNVVQAEEMPWENSPDGLIKHLVHHRLHTRECC